MAAMTFKSTFKTTFEGIIAYDWQRSVVNKIKSDCIHKNNVIMNLKLLMDYTSI